MMIAEILVAHLVGDYLLQTHWMATEKLKRWWPAVIHGVVYTLPFLFFVWDWRALLIIAGTHIVLDRYRVARWICWFQSQFAPRASRPVWGEDVSGFPAGTPVWLATWLMIIVDNTVHILINIAAVAAFN